MSANPRRTSTPNDQASVPYGPVELPAPDAAAVATAFAFAFDQLSRYLMANRDKLS